MTTRLGLVGLALALSLFMPAAARAQEDGPTPFWMPGGDEAEQPKKKDKKKKPSDDAPARPKKSKAPPPDDDAVPARPKKAKKAPPPEEDVYAAPKPKKAKKAPEPPPERIPERAEEPKPKKKYAPLPPIPTIEPEAPKSVKGKKEPYQSEPEHYGPTPLNMEPAPVPQKRSEPGQPAPGAPSWQAPPQQPQPAPSQGTRTVVPMDERPARSDDRLRPDDRPRPVEAAPQPPAQTLTPIDERPVAGSEPEPESPDKLRRLSVALMGGLWGVGVADGTGRTWEFAKGGRVGYQLFRPLLVDLTVLHASATSGNAFANASDGHLEVLLRAHYLYTKSIVTLGAGLGAGGSFAMTTYLLTPPGADPSSLSANALKLVAEGGVLMWVRPWRGLTVELEVNELLRDGRLEPLLTLGLGWAF